MTNVHLICSFINDDSSVVLDMLNILFHDIEVLHSRANQNQHPQQQSCTFFCTLPHIQKLCSASYTYHHNKP